MKIKKNYDHFFIPVYFLFILHDIFIFVKNPEGASLLSGSFILSEKTEVPSPFRTKKYEGTFTLFTVLCS